MDAGHLPCERFELTNGLQVVLHQDRRLPLAALDLWYHVGSRDDPPGRTGLAHLFEHLMFMGTPRVPGDGFDRLLEAHGGANNASTSQDRTAYTSWGPRELLPTLLWLEADRMRDLGRTLTQETLELQRAVVRNERRQSYEMRPYGSTWLVLGSLLYPEGHPYRHPVIGSHADIEAATLEDARQFFERWYTPANATLCVAGDLEPEATFRQIEAMFGDIPGHHRPERDVPKTPRLMSRSELTLEDEVSAPGLVLAWPSPARFSAFDAEMDLLADLLAEGAASRLEQALIHRETLAQHVEAAQVHGALASEFVIEIIGLPDVPLEHLEAVVKAELTCLCDAGPTHTELERLITLTEVDFVRAKQELLERTDDMNLYLSTLGDPDRLQWDLERYRAVSVDSMRAAARELLDPERHVCLRFLPGARRDEPAVLSEGDDPDLGSDDAPPPTLPPAAVPAPPSPWSPPVPVIHQSAEQVPGWHLRSNRPGLTALSVVIPRGAETDPPGAEGRCAMLCEFMAEAANGRDAEALDAALDTLGTELSVTPHRGSVSLNLSTLSRHLDESLDILSDILHRPDFLETDLDRVRELTLATIAQRRTRPEQVATMTALAHVLGPFPGQGHPILGEAHAVSALDREGLRAAHSQLRRSMANARWVACGDLDGQRIAGAIAERFPVRGATEPTPGTDPLPPASGDGPLSVLAVHRPGSPQTVVRFMRRVPHLGDPELPALELVNAVVGGTFLSRLNQDLRERRGLTYGVGSALWTGGRSGIWTVSTSVDGAATDRAVDHLIMALEDAPHHPPTEDERVRALAGERAVRIRAMESVDDVVSGLTPWAEAGLGPDAAAGHLAAMSEVTAEELAHATRWTRPRDGVLVLVGDADRFLPAVTRVSPTPPVVVREPDPQSVS